MDQNFFSPIPCLDRISANQIFNEKNYTVLKKLSFKEDGHDHPYYLFRLTDGRIAYSTFRGSFKVYDSEFRQCLFIKQDNGDWTIQELSSLMEKSFPWRVVILELILILVVLKFRYLLIE